MDRLDPVEFTDNSFDSSLFYQFVEEHPEPIVVIDETWRIRYANATFRSALGLSGEALEGRALTSLSPAAAASSVADTESPPLEEPLEVPLETSAGRKRMVFTFARHEHAGSSLFFGTGSERPSSPTFETLKRAVDNAGHAIYVTEVDGTITYVNDAFETVTGYRRAEAIGETPHLLYSGKMPAGYFAQLWETIMAGDVWEEDVINRRKNGNLYTAHQTIAPVSIDGNLEAFVAIQTDITERVTLDRRLRQYRSVVEHVGDPIMLQGLDGTFELINEAVSEFSGFDRDALFGNDEQVCMDQETATKIAENKLMVIESEAPLEYEVSPEFPHSSREASFSTRRYPYYDDSGALAGTIAICRDVSRLKEREKQLRQYKQAITGATDLIAAVDRDGGYLFANPNYCAYHDIDPERVNERTIDDVFDEEDVTQIEYRIRRALQGEVINSRGTRSHPIRGERVLDGRYYPFRDDDGSVAGVVAVLRDVTDEEDQTHQLRVVDQILRHNLRNDLTVVRGFAGQIADTESGASARAAETIIEQVDDLLTTSGKSREITQLLSDRPTIEQFHLEQAVKRLVDSCSNTYEDATITFESELESDDLVSAIPPLEEAIVELLENAVVHNDCDEPTVDIRLIPRGESIDVRIRDDGPGMAAMDADVLESGRAVEDLYHGSGLGLWLVYWIVKQSGGSTTVRDRKPRGTVVTMSVPRA